MVLTQGRKRLILGGVAIFAALAVAVPFLPRVQTIAAPYTGVMRVSLPNYTRITLPGSATGDVVSPGETGTALTEETAAATLDEKLGAAEPDAGTRPAGLAKIGPGGLIPVKFDIETPGLGEEVVGGDEIIVRKSVRLGSREIGKLPIHVDSRSRLLIRPSDLKSVLASAGEDERLGEKASSNELRSFAELRKDGLDLRYDPGSDSVVLTIG